MTLRRLVQVLRAPVLGFVISLLACSLFLWVTGEAPFVLVEAFRNTYLTDFGLGYTLFYTTPLIFTGLAVAVSFHCGLFNIGAEGQLYVGSMAVVLVAATFPNLPWLLAVPLGILAAFAAGGLWGGVAGYLKAKRGSHEVIVTILLNFIGAAIVDYLLLYPFHNPESSNPESLAIATGYQIPKLSDLFHKVGIDVFKSTPVNISLFLAIAAMGFVYFFLFYTTTGFELRAVGQSPTASRFAGVSVRRRITLALFLSGGIAGLVGVNEVMGYQHKLIQGFSPQYGFTGIAVALLARNHPVGIFLSAFLFGSLHNCARELEFLSEKVTKELSLVLQGVLIAFVACDYLFEKLWKRRKTRAKP
jgi:general nucleoside transport system permease protein